MDPSRRVWKWASAALAVLCTALGVVHFHLVRVDKQSADWVEIRSQESGVRSQEEGAVSSSPPQKVPELGKSSGLQPTTAPVLQARASAGGRRPPLQPGAEIQNPKSKVTNQETPSANPQSPAPDLIRPLGIVEHADGRRQAVIQDGEWVQLVEEGQVLADNTRVGKISAEAVELIWPPAEAMAEWARGQKSEPDESHPAEPRTDDIAMALLPEGSTRWDSERAHAALEPAPSAGGRMAQRQSGGTKLPGLESAAASSKTSASDGERKTTEVVSEIGPPDNAPALQGETSHPPSAFAQLERIVLGEVKHPDGRVQRVLADGPWVRLTADPAEAAQGTIIATAEIAPPFRPRQQDGGRQPAAPAQFETTRPPVLSAEQIQNPKSPIQNLEEPIGFVEWADGRAQAVVVSGDSVQLASDAAAVASTRRFLALNTTPKIPGEDYAWRETDQPFRPSEEELAWLDSSEDESRLRAPPEPDAPTPAEPDEIARGEPELDALADFARPPPLFGDRLVDNRELDMLEFGETAGASLEQSAITEPPLSEKLAGVEGAVTGSVPASANQHPRADESVIDSEVSRPAPEPALDLRRIRRAELLGFVRWPEGRVRAVIAFGDSVQLVAEGEELPDGSRVTKVEDGRVVIEPAADNALGDGALVQPDAPRSGAGPIARPVIGSEVQLGAGLWDNPVQTRK